MGGPDKVFGSGTRDAAKVSSAKRELPADDQLSYGVVEASPPKDAGVRTTQQRKASRETGVRDPETQGDGEA